MLTTQRTHDGDLTDLMNGLHLWISRASASVVDDRVTFTLVGIHPVRIPALRPGQPKERAHGRQRNQARRMDQ